MPWKNTQMDFYKMCKFNKLASFTSTFCSGYPIICRKKVPIYEEDFSRSYSLPTTGCPPKAVAWWRAWAIEQIINPAVRYIPVISAAAQERKWYQWLYKPAAQESISQRVRVQIFQVHCRCACSQLCAPTKFRKTWNKTGSEKARYMRGIMRQCFSVFAVAEWRSSRSHNKQWNLRRSQNDSKRESNDDNKKLQNGWSASFTPMTRLPRSPYPKPITRRSFSRLKSVQSLSKAYRNIPSASLLFKVSFRAFVPARAGAARFS